MTHASIPTTLLCSCPVLARRCHLIKLGGKGRQKVRGELGGIIAGCQVLVTYIVVVRGASNWLGEIMGVKPRDKLDSTGSLGWYTGSAGRFWGWPSYLFGKLGKAWGGEVTWDPRDVESGIWAIAWSGMVLWQNYTFPVCNQFTSCVRRLFLLLLELPWYFLLKLASLHEILTSHAWPCQPKLHTFWPVPQLLDSLSFRAALLTPYRVYQLCVSSPEPSCRSCASPQRSHTSQRGFWPDSSCLANPSWALHTTAT